MLPERDIYALGKMLALLFPHSLKPVIRRCLASDRSRYISVRQVRAALHRYWRMRWLMPWILAITTIIAFVIVFQPNPTETAQISEIQTDTGVVVPAKPAVDSIWLNLKYEIDKQYTSLYITYADSLTNMPEKTMNAAIYKLSGYANELLKEHKYLTDAYPQYEDSLQELYLAHLVRDHNRLQSICEDYPMIYSKKYSNKTE